MDFSKMFPPVSAEVDHIAFVPWCDSDSSMGSFLSRIPCFFPLQGENDPSGRSLATLADVKDLMNDLTDRIFNWAKDLPQFAEFQKEDQIALVLHHRIPHLVFEIAARSIGCDTHLLMGRKHFIARGLSTPFSRLGYIIDCKILKPLEELELDEIETVMINCILFFDYSEYLWTIHFWAIGGNLASTSEWNTGSTFLLPFQLPRR